MRWEGNRESSNVEDHRGSGGRGFGFGGRSIGIGAIVIALVGGAIFGINPLAILSVLSGAGAPVQVQQGPAKPPPADDQMARFTRWGTTCRTCWGSPARWSGCAADRARCSTTP